jgi:hypothetical protein
MFWRPQQQPTEDLRGHLKAQLHEHLRTAFDFATLGAYEPEPSAHPVTPREPQARVFLFAKVSAPCPHSPVATATCDAAGSDSVEHRRAAGTGHSLVRTRARSRRARRGGAVRVAPQPCTWRPGPIV